MAHFSKIYLEQRGNIIYFCHKPCDYFIGKDLIPVYDKDGNFVTTYFPGYNIESITISVDDYINSEDEYIIKNNKPFKRISDFYISYNFKPILVKLAFEIQMNSYCQDRQIMGILANFLNKKIPGERNWFFSNDEIVEADYDRFTINEYYEDQFTINNSFPIECVGIGGKASFVKIHKSIKPLLYSDYGNADSYEIEINKKFIKNYLGNKKIETIDQKLNTSIFFLNHYDVYERNFKKICNN
jgi:hypothetical protein